MKEGFLALGGVFVERRRQRKGRLYCSKELKGTFQVEIKPEPEVQES